jgi:hypothetical protein
VVSLLELGVHNPLALAIGDQGESEKELAARLIERIPEQSLLLGDRYYGVGPMIALLLSQRKVRSMEFLVRVQERIRGQVIQLLA